MVKIEKDDYIVIFALAILVLVVFAKVCCGQDEIENPLATMRWTVCDSATWQAVYDSACESELETEIDTGQSGGLEWIDIYIWLDGYVYFRHWHLWRGVDGILEEKTEYRRAKCQD